MVAVVLDGVTMRYPEDTAVEELHLSVDDGEAVVLLGPSGSGKTTVLRLLAGLDSPTAGSILFDGQPVNDVKPAQRNVAMVFQDEVLYPMNVGANIGFPLISKRLPEAEITARVQAEAKVLGLDRVLGRPVQTLAAGHRHLVQLARAMVRAPDLFLIDEPLGRLDPAMRRQLRTELRLIQQGYGVTAIYATHDQEDAMALADRLVIMDEGQIRQIGTGVDVYRRPADLSVAGFVGSPPMAILRGTGTASGVAIDELVLPGPPVVPDEVMVGVRSEDWRLSSEGIPASVTRIENLGSHRLAGVETIAGTATVRLGDEIAGVGDEVRLVPTRYHLFDAATGRSVYHSDPE